MQNSKDIQELIYRTIENISKELINKTNYLYLVEGKVTEIDTLGNCYVFKYQDEDYVGFSITGEKYSVGDLIYVLFSNNKDVKKMILSKTKAFSNNDIRRLVNSAQDSANEAKENAQEALDRIQEIGQDGNISPNEKLMIKKDWENIKIEYTQVTEEMELYGGSKNKILKPLKEQYDNNYTALKSYIEPILEDLTSPSKIDSGEFLEKFNNYYSVRQEIAQAIADITKTIADETQELAKINKKLLADIANDDKLTPSEKQSILKEFQGIIAEYKLIIEQAKYYGLIYTDYDNSYNELTEYLNPLLDDLSSTSDITGIVFRQYFINYYTERQKLQKSISDTAKDMADEAEEIANEALKNTKLLSIEADGQIFSKTSDSTDFYPNYISLSVKTNVVTFDKFQYKTSTTDWQDIINEEHGFSIIGEILTISKDSDLFTSSNNNITIQALSSDSSIKDIFTIVKVQDGVMGENALSVVLTNEAHVFPAGVSAALNSTTETEILAFDGATPTEIQVKSISTLPSGLTAQISNNNTLKPKITFTATTLLTQVKDVIITLVVKGQEIQKHFSYTLGLKGEPGENAWSIVLGNDSQNIPCTSAGMTSTTLVVDIPVYTFYGTLMMASTLSVGTLPSGVVATSITNGTASAPGNVQLTFSNNINLGRKNSGTIDININASNKNFIKKFSWSKTKQGEEGAPGEEGLGIKNIIEYYQVSDSNTVQPTSWTEEIPIMTSVNRFLWNYEKIIYTDDSFKETDKKVIGVYGDQGETGTGVSSIIEQYYLSTSNTSQTGGKWKTTQDAWTSGKYIWTRSEITWTDGNVTHTDPVLADALNKANTIANTANTNANNAIETANDASSTANTATSTANDALKKANTVNQGLSSLTTIVENNYKDLQGQIDGAIATWFYSYEPNTPNTLPTSEWTTDTIKDQHLGDLFYIVDNKEKAGQCYRYAKIDGAYKWVIVEDVEIAKAIADAANAQATADGKATIYTGINTPTAPQEGDLWMKSADSGILTYVNGAWIEYNKYTDDTLAQSAKDAADTAKDTADTAHQEVQNTVNKVDIEYYLSTSATELIGGSWSTTAPEWVDGKYIWSRQKMYYVDSKKEPIYGRPACITGGKGATGATGKTTYFHIKYAPVANPTNAQLTDTPSEYIGTYVDFNATASTSASKYTWSKFQGTDGKDGANGTPGTNGANGETSYLHIAYANSANGSTDFSITEATNKKYMGQYVDFVEEDSTDPTDYKWSLIKGADGETGANGRGIKSTTVTYQVSSSGTTTPTGTWTTSIPTVAQGEYLWTKTTITYTDNTTSNSYSVSRAATDGSQGVGIKSVTNKYAVSTSNTTKPTTWYDTPQTMTSTNKYLWNYEIITYTNNTTSKTDARVIGTYGDKGDTGAPGATGNGISSIVEKYAVSSSNSTAPTTWYDTVQTMSATNKYLWNYEIVTYTNGTTTETSKRVIGVYGDKGATGSKGPQGETGETGNGIQNITNYYLASASSSDVTTSTSGWTTTIQSATSNKKYLWNYETITYTNGKSISSTPCIIGTYGDKGDSGRVYFLEPSSLVIKKGSDNVLNPSTITFQSYYRDGTSATRSVYSGRFIIQESTDGNNYTTKYTSSTNESSKIYTPSSSNIKSIKCILYAAGGTTTQLDSQTVVVLTDIDNIEIGGRNLLMQYIRAGGQTTKINDLSIKVGTGVADTYFYLKAHQKLIKGETYTISCDASNVPSGCNWSFGITNQGAVWQLHINKNGRCYATGTPHIDTILPGTDFLIDDSSGRPSTAPNIILSNFKLELGNKPTDWTPAPEDIQENISNSKQEAIEASRAYVDVKEKEISSNVENIKTVVDGHTTAISTVQSSVQQTENKVNTVFTQTEEIKNLTDQNTTQLEEYKQYISIEPVKHEGETEARPTITLGQSTSRFKVAIDNKEIAFTGASGEKVAYITGDKLRINNVVVVRKLAIGDFFLEQEENGHLVLKKGG